MTPPHSPVVVRIGQDETRRLSCRQGQYILWLQLRWILSGDKPADWNIVDFWELKDGDFITITNRLSDLPVWFQLYPGEIGGARMIQQFQSRLDNNDYADEPVDGLNLWRLSTGTRLAWISVRDASPRVLEMIDVAACVLAIGESNDPEVDASIDFGLPETEISSLIQTAWTLGLQEAAKLGTPRSVAAAEWKFGW